MQTRYHLIIYINNVSFLDWGVDEGMRESKCEGLRRKFSVFGLKNVMVDVWGKFIEVCEWYDSYKSSLNYF